MYKYNTMGSRIKRFFILILIMVLVSILSILAYDMYINIDITPYLDNTANVGTRIVSSENTINNEILDNTNIIENATKCVVGISKIKNSGDSIFGGNSVSALGLGTGIIVSSDGYILTNWHVAGNKYSSCYITLENGEVHNGNVVWAEEELDLAIVKINARGLQYLNLGDSDSVKLGNTVYAIGNPIGIEFQRTVTSGIISGLNRTVKLEENEKVSYMEDLIQTDATINPGNSGGPLINSKGEVIGINSIKINTAEGIGFAIPINIVKPIIEKYSKNGVFEEAYLGIFAFDKAAIPYLDSNVKFDTGVYIVQVAVGRTGERSGLKVGDIITKIDGTEITKMSELRRYIYTKTPKDIINIMVLRNNKEQNFEIILEKK